MNTELLQTALACLAAHHESEIRSAHEYAVPARITDQRIAHYQEQLYQIGEQIALLGGRNAWLRS